MARQQHAYAGTARAQRRVRNIAQARMRQLSSSARLGNVWSQPGLYPRDTAQLRAATVSPVAASIEAQTKRMFRTTIRSSSGLACLLHASGPRRAGLAQLACELLQAGGGGGAELPRDRSSCRSCQAGLKRVRHVGPPSQGANCPRFPPTDIQCPQLDRAQRTIPADTEYTALTALIGPGMHTQAHMSILYSISSSDIRQRNALQERTGPGLSSLQ